MDGDLFYVLGGVLVAAALVLAFTGIRGAGSFPRNRAVLAGVTGIFAAIVVTTLAFAVDLSEEEQAHREHELAEEEHAAEEEQAAEAESPAGQPQASEGGQQEPQVASTSLDVTSPEDGGLTFEPDGLEAAAGNLTITYSNPSAVSHSLALESNEGEALGETSVFTSGEESVEVSSLAPGEYVFFCTVPGHREAGMQGSLTVQ